MLRVTLLLGDKSRGWSSESSESSMGVSLLRRRLPREISGKSLSTVCLKPVSEAIIIVCLSLWSRVAFSCFSRGKDEERPQSTISLMMEDINYPSNQFNISWNQSIWEDANISYILSQVTGLEVCLGTNGANFSTYLFNVTRWIKIVEGHSKISCASVGIVFNLLAIATLLWPPKRLKSHFHGMVVQLLLIESISVILDLNHSVRVLRHGTQCGNILSAVWAAYVLHPLEKMLKYCSIFIMVIIAKEQTNALRSPSAYQYNLQERSFVSTLKTTYRAFIWAFVISLPLMFESVIEPSENPIMATYEVPKDVYNTIYCPRISEEKYSTWYVIIYRGFGVFLPTMVLPFALLCRYSYQMWWILRRRSAMKHRPRTKNPTSSVLKEEAAQNCKAFCILTGFLAVCSAPDFLLGVREALYADSYIYGIENKCSAIPMWVHQTETMKQLFMTAFSSFGGVIYCISCIRFRKKIKLLLGRTPRVPNNSLAEENENEISCTNEKIPLEILSNDQLKVQAENMALYPRSPSSAAML